MSDSLNLSKLTNKADLILFLGSIAASLALKNGLNLGDILNKHKHLLHPPKAKRCPRTIYFGVDPSKFISLYLIIIYNFYFFLQLILLFFNTYILF